MTRRTTIDRQSWAAFCDAYTRQHHGWISNIETYDPDLTGTGAPGAGARLLPLASSLALQGIVLEDRHPQPDLVVSMGSMENPLSHRIVRPSKIVAVQTDTGLDEGLLVHDESGGLMQIRFRVPAAPAALDGLTPTCDEAGRGKTAASDTAGETLTREGPKRMQDEKNDPPGRGKA